MKRNGISVLTKDAHKAFEEIKTKIASAGCLALQDFDKLFEVDCDASGVGIGAVLNQGSRPMTFFSEKLTGAQIRNSTYETELYTMVRALQLQHWRHYLLHHEFVLYSDHEALKHFGSQATLSHKQAQWISFLEEYNFVLKQKSGAQNRVADALSRQAHCLSMTRIKVIGFGVLPELYASDPYFSAIYSSAQAKRSAQHTVHDGFHFRRSQYS
jgi:hypothetical protein